MWTLLPAPRPAAPLRLFCLPHAGAGAATFAPWGKPFAERDIELRAIRYPGRETRAREKPIHGWREMVAALADVWAELGGRDPYVIFGHSMGGLLAFELVAELRRRGERLPSHLFISARIPPHAKSSAPLLHPLADRELVLQVGSRFNGISPELVSTEGFVEWIAPILRADFTLVETYDPSPDVTLTVPLTIFEGTNDTLVEAAKLRDWGRYTTGGCRHCQIAGDHFFHQKMISTLVAEICRDVARRG
jgi:medium-chain acyl-[acyl-carrier-protein] hydrolase